MSNLNEFEMDESLTNACKRFYKLKKVTTTRTKKSSVRVVVIFVDHLSEVNWIDCTALSTCPLKQAMRIKLRKLKHNKTVFFLMLHVWWATFNMMKQEN